MFNFDLLYHFFVLLDFCEMDSNGQMKFMKKTIISMFYDFLILMVIPISAALDVTAATISHPSDTKMKVTEKQYN